MNHDLINATYEQLLSRIAKLLFDRRQQAGLSKSAFARELNLPRIRYSNIEAAKARLYLDEVIMLSSALGIEPGEIWSHLTGPQAERNRERVYKVDVPADAGEQVHIVVNVVKGKEQSKKD